MEKLLIERPDQIPEEIWQWLPAFPMEYPGICGVLPLPRILLDKWCLPPTGAQFRVTSLSISPAEVNPGQPVTIAAMVQNIGNEAGTYTVHLGGDFAGERAVSLEPGETTNVSFEVVGDMVKTYSVTVNGLQGSFRVTEAPVADIRLGNLAIEPTEVIVGEPVTISVVATNYGSVAGTRKIVCTVGVNVAEQSVTLTPSESKTVFFEITPREAGTYQVSVDSLTGSFLAKEPLPERIGSFTLYAKNFNPLATRWRTIYKDHTHQDNRYLSSYRSLSSSFKIIEVDLNYCEIRVTQRKDGLIGAVWYGPFSGLIHASAYTLYLDTGELLEEGEPEPVPPPPPTTRLFGYVTDAITGAPIAGATGTVYQDYDTKTKTYHFTTDSQGYYEIIDMLYEVDVTQMVIYAAGYQTYTNENVPIGEGDNALDVQMFPPTP